MTPTDAQKIFDTLKTEQERLKFLKNLSMRDCFYSAFLKKNLESISTFLTENNLSFDVKLIKEVFQGVAKRCPFCGNWMLSKKSACSRKCSGKDIAIKNKERLQQKYGVSNVFQLQTVKEKIKETNLEKYGVQYSSERPEWVAKVKETNLNKYGVEYVSQLPEVKDLVRLKLSGNFEHSKDMNIFFVKEHFIQNGKFLNDDFMAYFNITRKTALKYRRMLNIEEPLEYKPSRPQKELYDWIPCDNKILNDRNLIAPNELDIVLPDAKLAIEYNGLYYHSDEFKPKNYHLQKTDECEAKGYKLFQIYDSDDLDIWKSMISGKLGLNRRIYARKCYVAEIPANVCNSFCAQNHLQGTVPSHIRLGLYYDDGFSTELVEVMTFGKSRYNKYMQYELLRLCSLKYTSVIGGASKLFKYFVKKYNPESVISYANRRFSQGGVYEVLGFTKQGLSSPNYQYIINGDLYSRVKFQKHKLSKVLESFDPNLSEIENMHNNGYFRIFDCGNIVYTWKPNGV